MMSAREKRLLKKYGRSQAWYEEQMAEQGGRCAICGRPPGKLPLSVDHDHRVHYHKVKTVRETTGWRAEMCELGIVRRALRRNEAIREVREEAKRLSCRGLLCWRCNTGLQKFSDSSAHLRAGAEYLEAHAARIRKEYQWNHRRTA